MSALGGIRDALRQDRYRVTDHAADELADDRIVVLDAKLLTCDGRLARSPGVARRVELVR